MAQIKSLSGSHSGGPVVIGVDVLASGATVSTNAALGNRFRLTANSNFTLANPTGGLDGQQVTWELIQDGTGSRVMTLDSKFAFGTDITSAVLTTTANKRDFLAATYNATTDLWYVVGFLKGY